MRMRYFSRSARSATATIGMAGAFGRTLERQIEDILTRTSPRREADGVTRRVVSVLFVAIRGFVALCEETDPEVIGSILDMYHETIADSTGVFLGTIGGVLADTVVATWNVAYPQTDHALLAVNSALEIVDRLEDVNGRLRLAGFPRIEYAVGVNTGDALIRTAGRVRRETEVIGDSVNIAQIMSRIADGGTVLIGEGTRVSLGAAVTVEEMEQAPLPGKRKLVRTFRVLRSSGREGAY